MAFCFIGLSSAQGGSQDQAAIEQALRNALTDADLTPGYSWNLTYSDISDKRAQKNWDANRIDYLGSDGTVKLSQWFSEYADLRSNGRLQTAADFRSWRLNLSNSQGENAQAYDSLPGAVITSQNSGEENSGGYFDSSYDIWFWKNPQYYGFITTHATTSCLNRCKQDHERISALARSECERLAKLAYDRLPGPGGISSSKFGIKGDVLEVGLLAPIPNSKVTITRNGNPILTVIPDSKDGFYFVPLDSGTYGVVASAFGYLASKGMSEDHVVVGSGVNTTYNLRLLETPPIENKTSSKPQVGIVPYNGKNAATIVIKNSQICNSGSYYSCGNESGCGYSTGVSTAYGLCIINATLSGQEASSSSWTPPSKLGDVQCVEMSGVASIESLKTNEQRFSVAPGIYKIAEYLFVSEVNPGFSGSPCRHWWLKPPKVIRLQPGQTMTFENSAYEWSGNSKCTGKYFDCSMCSEFFAD